VETIIIFLIHRRSQAYSACWNDFVTFLNSRSANAFKIVVAISQSLCNDLVAFEKVL
jgi:hypothetical protein